MTAKAVSADARSKPNGGLRSAIGHLNRPLTRREFERLSNMVDELETRVAQNQRDLDVQFQRLAQLQAVIDRMQIAAKNARMRRTLSE